MAYNKESGMYEGYIYKIYNDVNDKVYIGQTTRSIKKRWAAYKCNVKNRTDNLAIHNAMRKYGIELFHIELIESYNFNTKEELKRELDAKEKFYILKYNCRIPNGYNITDGGCGISDVGCKEVVCCDPYTRKLYFYKSIDEAALHNGIPAPNVTMCCQGLHCCTDGKIYKYKEDGITDLDIEKYFKLYPLIYQYDLYGNNLNVFYSTIEAGEYLKSTKCLAPSVSVIAKNITGCCRGDRQTAYGYVWRRMNDGFDKYSLNVDFIRNKEKKTDKPVDVYTFNGSLVGMFENIKYAFEELGIIGKQTNQALRCCNGYNTTAFGYIWRFHDDPFNKYSCASVNGTVRINKYTQNGIFIDTYNNYKYAANSVNTTNTKAISDCCNGENHFYKGYLWFYINDPSQPDKTKIIN